ncbi:3140_t:CDS:1 [Paraglomus occultum]|uniref:3140_t:CDS:1 n=1 Tax=Paraglomus occultum TaxID=144539 RepID=A0A9N9BN94_9GLOM|nr:3140_t:CDS:1 [Paraglomus occultum]
MTASSSLRSRLRPRQHLRQRLSLQIQQNSSSISTSTISTPSSTSSFSSISQSQIRTRSKHRSTRSTSLLPLLSFSACLSNLPPEIISRVADYLLLADFSRLGRTCKLMRGHFQRDLLVYLKNVYGLSVRSGSLVLFAYAAHLQYRAPKLLDRILDEFFYDFTDSLLDSSYAVIIPSESLLTCRFPQQTIYKQRESRWATYWSVLYSLDKQPNLDPPCFRDDRKEDDYMDEDNEDGVTLRRNGRDGRDTYACRADLTFGLTSAAMASIGVDVSDTPTDGLYSTQQQGLTLCKHSSGPNATTLNPKLQFLEKYTTRMNAKFAAACGVLHMSDKNENSSHNDSSDDNDNHDKVIQVGGKTADWFLADVRQKKTYRMLISQNIRYGDVALLRFYLEKYGAPTNRIIKFTAEVSID